MRVTREGESAVIDAADLGKLLDLPAAEVAAAMRAGDITSRFETGLGEDAGTFRLTFWHGGRRVRLTCAEDGTVLKTQRTSTGRDGADAKKAGDTGSPA